MTVEQARSHLNTHLISLIKQTEDYFLTHEKPFGIAGMQDVDGRLVMFQKYNDKKLQKFVDNLKLPSTDIELEALIPYALRSYLKGLYPYAVLESQKAYWVEARREISLDSYLENHPEPIDEETTAMEETVENQILQEEIEKAQKMFVRFLGPQERVVWELRAKGSTIKYAASVLYPDSKVDQKLIDKIRYRFRLLEYRFACLVATREILHDRLVLQGLNLYPAQNKKYFGTKKLESLPSQERLMEAAKGKEEDTPKEVIIVKPEGNWEPISKIDFNGKKHDHWVIYKTPDNRFYDHATKTIRDSI